MNVEPTEPTRHPRWRGTSIVAIAALHTAFSLLVATGLLFDPETLASVGGRAPLAGMTPGFGSASPPDLPALTFFWSIAFGVVLATLGLLVRHVERRGAPVPRPVGGLLLGVGLVGAILIPVSGFALLLPAGWSIARSG